MRSGVICLFLFFTIKLSIYSKPFFVPSISSCSNFVRGIIPNAVSLYEVAPLGLVDDFLIHYYLNKAETFLRVIRSPSSFVVRKIISGIKIRKKSNTFFFLFVVRYVVYAFINLVCSRLPIYVV